MQIRRKRAQPRTTRRSDLPAIMHELTAPTMLLQSDSLLQLLLRQRECSALQPLRQGLTKRMRRKLSHSLQQTEMKQAGMLDESGRQRAQQMTQRQLSLEAEPKLRCLQSERRTMQTSRPL